jgi:hypothetical protein
VGEPPKVSEQLPENRRIHRDAHRLPFGLTRQPSDGGAVKLPSSIFVGIVGDELVELAQCKLRASISVTQTPLELKEAVQLARDRAEESRVHRGTRSPTLRKRLNATRT